MAPTGTPLSPISGSSALIASMQQQDSQWVPATEQPAFSAPLTPKPTAPLSLTVKDPRKVKVVKRSSNAFFFDIGREAQGGVILTVALPPALASSGPEERLVTVTVAEELVAGENTTIMYPPRTKISPQTTWSLAATTKPQTIQHHEYVCAVSPFTKLSSFESAVLNFFVVSVSCALDTLNGDMEHSSFLRLAHQTASPVAIIKMKHRLLPSDALRESLLGSPSHLSEHLLAHVMTGDWP